MHPDLVGAAGLEVDLEQAGEPVRLERLVVGDAVLAVLLHRELPVGLRVPADRRVDGALERVGVALHQRVVGLVDRAVAGRRSSAGVRRARSSRSPSRRTCPRPAAARSPAAPARRWWRSGSPRRAGARPRSGPVQPIEGCTATPTGLSTTTMSSSSWMIPIPSTTSATHLERVGSRGKVTSSSAPGTSRSDFAAGLAVDGDQLAGRPGRPPCCGRCRTSARGRRRRAPRPGRRAPAACVAPRCRLRHRLLAGSPRCAA